MINLGISGKILNWVKAFLSSRKQRVRVENKFSSWTPVISGIPQCSVLGPTLFVLFINDLSDVCSSMCQLFADDAIFFRNVFSSEEINELQDDLNRLMELSEIWQLSFNLEKCKSLHIGRSNLKHVYKMKGKNLKQVVDEKDLGVIIDTELSFIQKQLQR